MAKRKKKRGKRKLPPNAPRFVKKLPSGKCPFEWQGRKVDKIKFKKKSRTAEVRRSVMAKQKKRKASKGRKAPGCHCPSTWRGKRVTAKGGGCRVKGHKGSVKKVGKDCK